MGGLFASAEGRIIVQMPGRLRDRRWQPLSCVGVAVYCVFLAIAPFEHHDLLCHLKTPQHCTACTSSQLGSDPHTSAVLGAWHLSDAGRAVTFQLIADDILLPVRSTGRSPPIQL